MYTVQEGAVARLEALERMAAGAALHGAGRAQARPAGVVALDGLLPGVLDALGCGLVLVDAEGHVLHANAAAVQQCREGLPLVLPATGQPADGLLAALPAAEALRLHTALRHAARGQWALVTLQAGERAVSLGVAPIRVAEADGTGAAPVALLMLGAERGAVRLSRQFFDSEHQLTKSERAVLDALCDGCTPQEIAAQGQVKISTVRTQIAAIREKVGAPSIRRLLQRVAALPPMAGLCWRRAS
ncbi:LuxR C-terminal-related transcriptional regulator [Ideonella sp. DXS22W]|uniref:LuxR C-terminal-related transcriptional regulator n=1 Tax=Pseudaquabacterium inlustre TaxID=2984192 RepID=A0ABU9CMU5_9BURK